MTKLNETTEWTDNIYAIRESDPVVGGADGVSNRQATQLANRTRWLKSTLDSHMAAADPYPQYHEAAESVHERVDMVMGDIAQMAIEQAAHGTALVECEARLAQLDEVTGSLRSTLPAPSGSQLVFVQSAAPTGWTKLTAHNDKALRIVSGTASSGGAVAFSAVFSSRGITGNIGNTTLSVAQMPSHTHTFPTGYGTDDGDSNSASTYGSYSRFKPATSATGAGNAHSHSLSIDAPDFNVQYVDAIIARKD